VQGRAVTALGNYSWVLVVVSWIPGRWFLLAIKICPDIDDGIN